MGSINNYSSTGSDDGLSPARRQPNIWTNDGIGWWRIFASLGLNELNDIGWSKLDTGSSDLTSKELGVI